MLASRDSAGEILHLIGEFFVTRRDASLTAARTNLAASLVFAGEHFGFDAHVHHLLLAVHFYRDHPAAG